MSGFFTKPATTVHFVFIKKGVAFKKTHFPKNVKCVMCK